VEVRRPAIEQRPPLTRESPFIPPIGRPLVWGARGLRHSLGRRRG